MCASLVLKGLAIELPRGNTTNKATAWHLVSSFKLVKPLPLNPWAKTGTLGISSYPPQANLLLSSMVPNCLPFGQLGQAWHGCLHSGKAWWCHPSVGCSCLAWSWALGFFLTRSQCLACSTSGQLGLSAGKQSPWDHVGLHQAIAKVAETLWWLQSSLSWHADLGGNKRESIKCWNFASFIWTSRWLNQPYTHKIESLMAEVENCSKFCFKAPGAELHWNPSCLSFCSSQQCHPLASLGYRYSAAPLWWLV